MTGITLYPYVNIENIFIDRKQNLYQWVSLPTHKSNLFHGTKVYLILITKFKFLEILI